MARDSQNALLLVPVLLRRLIQQIDEDQMVQKLCADDEPLHLLADVHREVAVGNATGTERTSELGRAEALAPAAADGGSGVGSEQAVLRRIGDSGQAADQLLHSW